MCKPISDSQVDVLGALADACYAFPHLRVGQLIDNAIETYRGPDGPGIIAQTLFYAEDEFFVKALNWYRETFATKEEA
jgi:hypothetical protein